jgi:hypothetical protein
MCGHIIKDRIRNEIIQEKVRVISIKIKMRETVCVGLNIYREKRKISLLEKLKDRDVMSWIEVKAGLRRYG